MWKKMKVQLYKMLGLTYYTWKMWNKVEIRTEDYIYK